MFQILATRSTLPLHQDSSSDIGTTHCVKSEIHLYQMRIHVG